ncbi:hypothetical protein O9929_16210 [Vibrio lentus]|nr:hypothetical protein [Vibrio lentus]
MDVQMSVMNVAFDASRIIARDRPTPHRSLLCLVNQDNELDMISKLMDVACRKPTSLGCTTRRA